jgi:hypothetical protein
VILALLLTLTAHACTFPEKARVLFAETTPDQNIALFEERSRCLYVISPAGPRILNSAQLTETPSAVEIQPGSGRIFFYYPSSFELRALDPVTLEEKLVAKLSTGRSCTREKQGDIEVEKCQMITPENLDIALSDTTIVLHSRRTLLAANTSAPRFTSAYPHNWYFGVRIAYSPESSRLLVLENLPSGESIVKWFVLNHGQKLLSPLPGTTLQSSGIKRAYFLQGGDYFLANTGLVYRTGDMQLTAQIPAFDQAFPLGEGIFTVSAVDALFKITFFSASLRAEHFSYVNQRPLLLIPGYGVFPQGPLHEIIRPLRGILYE